MPVLFADVVHSMDIAAAVGAERLREIMTELVSRCASVIQRYDGTMDKFTGDGVRTVLGRVRESSQPLYRTTVCAFRGRSWRREERPPILGAGWAASSWH